MKRILINAMTIKEGGGVVVFIKTINEMIQQDHCTKYYLVVDEKLRDQIIKRNNVDILVFPRIKKSPFHLLWWNEMTLPRLIKKLKIDSVYSQINTLPFKKLKCKTYLSVIHAGYFSDIFTRLNAKFNRSLKQKIGWFVRKNWVFHSIKKADEITVPTKALGDEISRQLKINEKNISVILPGAGLADGIVLPKTNQESKTVRIGYITKYGVQKNFEVLFAACEKLKANNVDFKLILTLNENHAPFQHIKSLIQQYHLEDKIENHGESSEMALRDLYLTLDLFIFPSLCESIGFTLLEAMYYAIPVIAANTASNCELLGESGVYFDGFNSDELYGQINRFIQNSDFYQTQSQYSYDRARLYSWEASANRTLRVLNV